MTQNTEGNPQRAREASHPVVVGVDGSDDSRHAAHWAAAEAGRRAATLTIVHAVDLPAIAGRPLEPIGHTEQRRAAGQAILDRATGELRARFPDLPIAGELSDLDPAHTLVDFSRVANLLVAGTRGHGGFTGMLLGSVSRKLAVHGRCPLVVVHEEPPESAEHRVVLGIGPKHSSAAARFAFEAAERSHAVLHAVRAWIPNAIYTGKAGVGAMFTGHPEADRRLAAEQAEAAVEPLQAEFPDVKVQISTYEGNAVDGLITAARDARLLVVCAHRHRGPFAVGAGYVVEHALAHCPTPVAVVPDE